MRRDKLKKLDIKYFLVPMALLVLLFFIITFITVNRRVQNMYDTFEDNALTIANSYSQALISTREAEGIITELLDHNLRDAINAFNLVEDLSSNEILEEIGSKFNLDEIHLYNAEGEIIFSKGNKYIGWKAYEGHPVHDFMISDENILVENIRKDTESDEYYKYAYLKNEDGTFLQIGMLADHIYNFISKFEIQYIIDTMAENSKTKHISFISPDYEIISSSVSLYIEAHIEDEDLQQKILEGTNQVHRIKVEDEDVLHVFVPIFYNDERIGTLSIGWPADATQEEVLKIFKTGIYAFISVVIVIGIILFYSYRKSQSNLEIAYYDKLTRLPNREYLYEYLQKEIRKIDKDKKAILLLNITNFKTLNITYGYNYANRIIVEMAKRLMDAIDEEDMLFHFGGDRFILFIQEFDEIKDLVKLANSIINYLSLPFSDKNEQQYVNSEVAIVVIEDEDITVDRVLQDATLALSLKERTVNGNSSVVVFNKEMEDTILRRERIEKAIQRVISDEDSSCYLVFQPKLDIRENKIIGFEALARMEVEGLGRISPPEFISIAEDRLLIYDLGKIIIRKSCEFLSLLIESGFKDKSVAINISGIQLLREEFLDDLMEITSSYNTDLKLLEFEITESVLLENYDLINSKLEKIKNMGIKVSLDDFGTGFSSLARLRGLNIDIVKIDRYFIDRISMQEEDRLISADIISMSHKIRLKVVAEGVEREDQLEYLRKYNCDFMQGYLLSRPLSVDDAIYFLNSFKEIQGNEE